LTYASRLSLVKDDSGTHANSNEAAAAVAALCDSGAVDVDVAASTGDVGREPSSDDLVDFCSMSATKPGMLSFADDEG